MDTELANQRRQIRTLNMTVARERVEHEAVVASLRTDLRKMTSNLTVLAEKARTRVDVAQRRLHVSTVRIKLPQRMEVE